MRITRAGRRHRRRPLPARPAAPPARATGTDAEVTVVGNTGDDIRLFGLQICPDLDTVMYTLGGGIGEERGLGPRGRDLHGQGGARGLRRRARLVRPRRPRHRDAPRAHPDARRGLPALRGHRRAVRPLAAGGRAAADERRPGRDPRGRRRRRARARGARSTSRSGGSGTARHCPPHEFVLVGVDDAKPGARCARGHRATPTSCCCRRRTRWCRSARSCRCPGCATRCARPRRPSSASPPSSAARRCAAWPTRAWPRSASRPRADAVARALRRPRRRRRRRRRLLDGWLVDDATDADGGRRSSTPLGHRDARGAAAHDRPRRDRGDRRPRRSTLAEDLRR